MEQSNLKVKLKLPENNPNERYILAEDDLSSMEFTVPVVNSLKIMEVEPVSSLASSPIEQLTFRYPDLTCFAATFAHSNTHHIRVGDAESYQLHYGLNLAEDRVIYDTVSGQYTVRQAENFDTKQKDDDEDALMSAIVTQTYLLTPQTETTKGNEGQKKKKRQLLDTDEVINFKLGADGKMKRVVKHRVRKIVRLSKEQMREIKDIFYMFDKDESGQMDIAELKDAMKALGFNYDRVSLKDLMMKADRDNSGFIELDEFKSVMAELMQGRNSEEQLAKAFKFYDDDEGMTIDVENLRSVAEDIDCDVSDTDLENMVTFGDRNNKYQGTEVDFEDFMYIMSEAKLY